MVSVRPPFGIICAAYFCVCLAAVHGAPSFPNRYAISKIASTEKDLDVLPSQIPEMTEGGKVLFIGRLDVAPFGVEAILGGNAGGYAPILSWTGVPREGLSGNLLGKRQSNALGEFVFRGGFGGSNRDVYIWTSEAGPRRLYSDFNFDGEPSINNNGAIAFSGSGQGLPEAVFVGDREGTKPAEALAATGGPLYEGFSRFFESMITDDGTVFVRADKDGAGGQGYYKLTGPGASTKIAEVGAELVSLSQFDVNNQNEIGFLGELASGERGILIGDENGLDLVAQDRARFRITNPPGLNDRGHFVYKAELDPGNRRLDVLLTGNDLARDRLIGEGDLLLGQTVTQLYAGRGGINNRGQIAFFASRVDPRTGQSNNGVFLATLVPEPPALLLIFSHLSLMLMGRVRAARPTNNSSTRLRLVDLPRGSTCRDIRPRLQKLATPYSRRG